MSAQMPGEGYLYPSVHQRLLLNGLPKKGTGNVKVKRGEQGLMRLTGPALGECIMGSTLAPPTNYPPASFSLPRLGH